MSVIDQAIASQLINIEKRSGKSLEELAAFIHASGLTKHGEIRDLLKREFGMGHGDANTLVHHVWKSDAASQAREQGLGIDEILDAMYAGPKAALRPIHDAVMEQVSGFGDFEIAPKKNYLSLRRKKQFAMIGPATKTRVEVGLNVKGLEPTEHLLVQPPGGMCNYIVKLTTTSEVDATLINWIRLAFNSAG